MIIYDAAFNFEVDRQSGDRSIVYPSKLAAICDARRLLREEMAKRLAVGEALESDGGIKTLECTVNRITVAKLSKSNVCSILNSQGGNYIDCYERLMHMTLAPGVNYIVTEEIEL